MATGSHLLLIGASVRAVAFSALRAGLLPWCADLFGDADLRARCRPTRLLPQAYPHGFVRLARQAPPGPWMYTGGLENRPALIHRLARCRRLWGNDSPVLAVVRSPRAIGALLQDAGLPAPAVWLGPEDFPGAGRWLIKPLAGSGGAGVAFWIGQRVTTAGRRTTYLQQYVEGDSCAAAYVGDGRASRLLGATRQLVGEPWLNAAPFRYCGSIGPLVLGPSLRRRLEQLGQVLARGGGLRGLFGVDFILRGGVPWPVEINPRYTASMEVLEYARQTPVLALHRHAFEPDAPPVPEPAGCYRGGIVGKAVLFARSPLCFPVDGPWLSVLQSPGPVEVMPGFADIPPAGQPIAVGRPVLTFYTRGRSVADCVDRLGLIAADLDRRLFGP
jgi:predicted ATP-grasp superfamily ATP-dependent carboligase